MLVRLITAFLMWSLLAASALGEDEEPAKKNQGRDGSITVEDSKFLVEVQAYHASRRAVLGIANEVKGLRKDENSPPFCVMVSSNFQPFKDYGLHQAVLQQLDFLIGELQKQIAKNKAVLGRGGSNVQFLMMSSGGAKSFKFLGDVPEYISEIASLFSFWKPDIKIKGSGFELSEVAVVAQVVASLNNLKPEVVTCVEYEELTRPTNLSAARLFKRLRTLRELTLELAKQKVLLQTISEADQKMLEKAEFDSKATMDVPTLLAETESLLKEVAAFVESLKAVDKETKQSILERISGASRIADFLDDDGADNPEQECKNCKRIVLFVKPVTAGGYTRSLSSPFNIGTVSFSGGTVLTYFVLSKQGLLAANTFSSHQRYQRVRDGDGYIEDFLGGVTSDEVDEYYRSSVETHLRNSPEWYEVDGHDFIPWSKVEKASRETPPTEPE